MTRPEPSTSGSAVPSNRVCTTLLGFLLGFSIVKLGNPAIFQDMIVPPEGFWELLLMPWPLHWGYLICLVCTGGVLIQAGFKPIPFGMAWLPAIWFAWQCLSAAQTINASLTSATLLTFGTAVLCYYAGFQAVKKATLAALLPGLFTGLGLMALAAFHQHFGGLEQARDYLYAQPNWQQLPAALLKKVASNRVYGTVFYPNTLASLLLLAGPLTLALLWTRCQGRARSVAWVLVGGFGLILGATLVWSGSKAGWLIALLQVLFMASRLKIRPWVRRAGITTVLLIGLGGFIWKYQGYLQRGATSVGARMDYWQVALQVAAANPILGTGPGTFGKLYAETKRPESEMARLAHNDYLQQASDSGWLAALLFTGMIALPLTRGWRICQETVPLSGLWVGLAGWAIHELMEFGLHIPATAWCSFLFLGCLTARLSVRQASPASVISAPL